MVIQLIRKESRMAKNQGYRQDQDGQSNQNGYN
jgi:hypothetical protein